MHTKIDMKSKAAGQSLTFALGLLLCGTAIGIVLAFGFSQVILDACQGDLSCQKPLLALFGGIGLIQVLNIIAVFALVDHLNRKSEERLIEAIR